MPTYPFMQVDAFTTHPLGGNPCAIVFEADTLDEKTMLAIAQEMNLSETSFVLQSNIADFRVRYFTPVEEVPLAGHPTIATTYALIDSGRLALTNNLTTINLELQVGPIQVDIQAKEKTVQQIIMSQKKPQFLNSYNPAQVLPIFGLSTKDMLPNMPIQTVSTGTPQLMIPLRNLEALKKIALDTRQYNQLRANADFFSTHLFCLTGISKTAQTFARHFVTPPALVEDPVTGSATGGMGAYIWHYGLLDTSKFIAEQGHWMGRPGQVTVEVVGPPNNIQTVKVGGAAVSIIKGELIL